MTDILLAATDLLLAAAAFLGALTATLLAVGWVLVGAGAVGITVQMCRIGRQHQPAAPDPPRPGTATDASPLAAVTPEACELLADPYWHTR